METHTRKQTHVHGFGREHIDMTHGHLHMEMDAWKYTHGNAHKETDTCTWTHGHGHEHGHEHNP